VVAAQLILIMANLKQAMRQLYGLGAIGGATIGALAVVDWSLIGGALGAVGVVDRNSMDNKTMNFVNV